MLQDIRPSIDIDAPRERVWTSMTSEGLVEHWLGCIGFKPEVGATFYMQPDGAKRDSGNIEGATHCEIEELDRPDRIAFSWFIPGTPKTRVTIELSDLGPSATRATLVHSGWAQFDADTIRPIYDMLNGGWSSFVLPGLKRVAEDR